MKITLTIEIDDKENRVTVVPEEEVKPQKETPNLDNVVIPEHLESIGERIPKGRNSTMPRPRTEDYPYNVADAKEELEKANVNIAELARTMGNFPANKLRNIFRYDNRRFTREEYNVILRAIQEIKKSREIM